MGLSWEANPNITSIYRTNPHGCVDSTRDGSDAAKEEGCRREGQVSRQKGACEGERQGQAEDEAREDLAERRELGCRESLRRHSAVQARRASQQRRFHRRLWP